ncbi:synaptotagmin-7-like [Symsagittifera roscoffensis]|uniref:synaptotagmin-7-like n=1 Tax=Symsagittifera roscoffensis TaxID=84072 RepID=UPI00307C9DC0
MALSLQSKHNRLMRPGRRTNVWDVFTCCFPHSHDPLEFGGDNDTGYEGSQDLVPHPHPIKLGPSKLIRRASDTSPSKKSGSTPILARRNSNYSNCLEPQKASANNNLPKSSSKVDTPNGDVAQLSVCTTGQSENDSFLNSFSDFMNKMSKPKDYCGEINFSLYYNDSFQYLRIYLFCAKNLLPMDSSGFSDPYVIMKLIPDKKRRHKSSVRFKTLNPKWEEEFYFRSLDYQRMFGSVLRLTVMDYDRMSPDDPIGEIEVDLHTLQRNEVVKLSTPLSKSCRKKNLRGEIQLTLLFNPVGKILRVTVNQVRNLKSMDVTGKADPYVVVKLMYNGKVHLRHRTQKFYNTLDATFDESFPFQLPPIQNSPRLLGLEVKVKDYDKLKWDDEIGRISLGFSSGRSTEEHWKETFANPGKSVTRWHDIKSKSVD